MNALALADEIFVPMQAHFLALQGVGRLLETVGLVCQSVNPDLRVTGILLCMHEKQTTLAKEVVADLDAFFDATRDEPVPWRDCRVLRPPIRRNIKLAEAPSFGQTIFDYAPWCHGALDYRKLALGLIEHWCEEDKPPVLATEPEQEAPAPAEEEAIAPIPDDPPDDDEPDLTPVIPRRAGARINAGGCGAGRGGRRNAHRRFRSPGPGNRHRAARWRS